MKKFILVSSFIIISLSFSIFYIFKDDMIDIDVAYEIISKEDVRVFFYKDGEMEELKLNRINDDIILDIFDYLTINKNYAKLSYLSYVPANTRIIDYQIDNKILTLNLNKMVYLISRENTNIMIDQIEASYKSIGFDSIKINVENIEFSRI